ncbi:MAG: hypothetical protein M0R77_10480 [Gammaproteobacteria bacterium]|nr:hypothetical protein [Gammaproteobacteria bacterium]
MKIEEAGVETFSLGQKEVSVAKIQASAKAFEILSSSLYSNNILAIIRELSANAKDSHKAAGCPEKPFDIQLPNKLDPSFKVRDYGVGMDHQFVMTRLNTYFDSTKNDSNEEIGGFGLGIKSGFSYTSSYMIVTFDGTTRRVYAFQIGASGLPEISFLAETPSTEPRGVELSIPVMDKDYDRFREEAIEALTFYEPKPNISGVDASAFDIKPLFQGTGWKIYQNPGRLKNENYVEMGNVIYPVIEENNPYDESRHYRHHRRGRGADMIMVYSAGIGEIDITPNREQIKLTDRSKARITKFEETVTEELMATIQGWLDKETGTLWEVLRGDTVRRIHDQSYFFESRKVDLKKLKYKGYQIMVGEFRYTEKSPAADKVVKGHTLQEQYGEIRMDEHRMAHYGIQISARHSESVGIIIGTPGWTAKLNQAGARKLINQTKKVLYLLDVKAADQADVIAGLNKTFPDFADNIYNWDDFKAGIKAAKPENDYYTYDLKDGNSRYYNEGNKKEFNIKDFSKKKTIYYGTYKPKANNLRNYHYNRESTRIQEILSSCYDETYDEILAKLNGEKVVYAFLESQVKELEAAGFKLVDFVTTFEELLHQVAVEFAAERPTMTLKEYLKPLQEKNPEISISTFYKAVKRWARECGMEDEYQLLLKLNDPSSSSYRASANDQLFRQVHKMTIKEYVKKHNLKPAKPTSNQFAIDLRDKAPLLSYLITRYSVPDVIDYVKKEVAGIVKAPAPAATVKAPPKRKPRPQPVVIQTINPLSLIPTAQ